MEENGGCSNSFQPLTKKDEAKRLLIRLLAQQSEQSFVGKSFEILQAGDGGRYRPGEVSYL